MDKKTEGKENERLSQTLAVMNGLACIRNFSRTGLPHSFEPADKMLLKIWVTASST